MRWKKIFNNIQQRRQQRMNGIEEEEEEEVGRIESRLKIIRHWHKISKALMKKEEKKKKEKIEFFKRE